MLSAAEAIARRSRLPSLSLGFRIRPSPGASGMIPVSTRRRAGRATDRRGSSGGRARRGRTGRRARRHMHGVAAWRTSGMVRPHAKPTASAVNELQASQRSHHAAPNTRINTATGHATVMGELAKRCARFSNPGPACGGAHRGACVKAARTRLSSSIFVNLGPPASILI